MIDASFLNQLSKFSLVVRKRVTSSYAGPRRSIAFGRGVTFKDHRIYARGDDFRNIDWKVYARTDDLYIKTFEEERNLTTHIIMDASNSMNFGKSISKFDYAAMIGTGFAYLSLKENDKFQFSTFSENVEVFQPRRGMAQLMSMISYLNDLKTKGASKLRDSLFQYKDYIGSRALLILISDFLFPIEEIKEALRLLGNHEIKIIQVLDPVEKELGFTGDYNLKDSETGQKLNTYISRKLRTKYQEMLTEHSSQIEDECNALNMSFYQITTDTPLFDAFYRILE